MESLNWVHVNAYKNVEAKEVNPKLKRFHKHWSGTLFCKFQVFSFISSWSFFDGFRASSSEARGKESPLSDASTTRTAPSPPSPGCYVSTAAIRTAWRQEWAAKVSCQSDERNWTSSEKGWKLNWKLNKIKNIMGCLRVCCVITQKAYSYCFCFVWMHLLHDKYIFVNNPPPNKNKEIQF